MNCAGELRERSRAQGVFRLASQPSLPLDMRVNSPHRLELTRLQWAGPQLAMDFELGAHVFHTSIWYGDVDLDVLADRIGHDAMSHIACHIAAFEINKLASR
jgi:hypothetical protein